MMQKAFTASEVCQEVWVNLCFMLVEKKDFLLAIAPVLCLDQFQMYSKSSMLYLRYLDGIVVTDFHYDINQINTAPGYKGEKYYC